MSFSFLHDKKAVGRDAEIGLPGLIQGASLGDFVFTPAYP